jgi:hypothetical protein
MFGTNARNHRACGAALLVAAALAVTISFVASRGSDDAPAQASVADAQAGSAGGFAISPPESLPTSPRTPRSS